MDIVSPVLDIEIVSGSLRNVPGFWPSNSYMCSRDQISIYDWLEGSLIMQINFSNNDLPSDRHIIPLIIFSNITSVSFFTLSKV